MGAKKFSVDWWWWLTLLYMHSFRAVIIIQCTNIIISLQAPCTAKMNKKKFAVRWSRWSESRFTRTDKQKITIICFSIFASFASLSFFATVKKKITKNMSFFPLVLIHCGARSDDYLQIHDQKSQIICKSYSRERGRTRGINTVYNHKMHKNLVFCFFSLSVNPLNENLVGQHIYKHIHTYMYTSCISRNEQSKFLFLLCFFLLFLITSILLVLCAHTFFVVVVGAYYKVRFIHKNYTYTHT